MTRDSEDRQDQQDGQDRQDRQPHARRRMADREPPQGKAPAETPTAPAPKKREPDPVIESVPSKMPSLMRTQSQSEAERSAAAARVTPTQTAAARVTPTQTAAAKPTPAPAPAPASAPAPTTPPTPTSTARPLAPQPQRAAAQPAPAKAVQHTQSLRELLARVDNGWIHFRAAAGAFPSERMDERLSDGGWTRKQMLAHIAAWHDLAHDRLGKLINTGKSTPLTESDEQINARVARQAMGRSAGEVLKEMEMTFNRLRRQLARLTDEQLELDDGWATFVIAANTYEHYDEHHDDVQLSGHAEGRTGRR